MYHAQIVGISADEIKEALKINSSEDQTNMKIIDSIIGSYSDRQIRKITPIVKKIEALADKYRCASALPRAKRSTTFCPTRSR